MPTGYRKCKVCGKDYEYCHTNRRVAGIFRYQDVACSPEHGSIYLARVLASRGQAVTENESIDASDVNDDVTALLEEDEEDEDEFDDDFDDDDEAE